MKISLFSRRRGEFLHPGAIIVLGVIIVMLIGAECLRGNPISVAIQNLTPRQRAQVLSGLDQIAEASDTYSQTHPEPPTKEQLVTIMGPAWPQPINGIPFDYEFDQAQWNNLSLANFKRATRQIPARN